MVLRNILVFGWIAVALTSCGGSTTEYKVDDVSEASAGGKELFVNHCAGCHGMDGALGLSGASDLSHSNLKKEEIMEILRKGRNGMPSLSPILKSEANMDAVTTYTLELRK